jgi:hypothetical protein
MPYYMPDTAFSLDRPGRKSKRKRQHANDHLAFIRTLPCLVTGKRGVHAAHIRYPDPRFAKRAVGIGEKPDDKWTVPLHPSMHTDGPDAQHKHNEREWWEHQGIDPVAVAAALWAATGDEEAGEQIIEQARQNARPS